jgi:amino acid transporter
MGDAPPDSEDWYRPTALLGGLLVCIGALLAISGVLVPVLHSTLGVSPTLSQSATVANAFGATVSALGQITGFGLGTPLIVLGAVFSGAGAFLLFSAWQIQQRSRNPWHRSHR